MTSITETLHALTSRNGGATVSLEDGSVATHTTGFYVGGLVPEVVVEDTGYADDLYGPVETIGAEVNWTGFIGTWKHEGNIYVDASEWYADFETAARVGRERGEKAIWEVAGGTEFIL